MSRRPHTPHTPVPRLEHRLWEVMRIGMMKEEDEASKKRKLEEILEALSNIPAPGREPTFPSDESGAPPPVRINPIRKADAYFPKGPEGEPSPPEDWLWDDIRPLVAWDAQRPQVHLIDGTSIFFWNDNPARQEVEWRKRDVELKIELSSHYPGLVIVVLQQPIFEKKIRNSDANLRRAHDRLLPLRRPGSRIVWLTVFVDDETLHMSMDESKKRGKSLCTLQGATGPMKHLYCEYDDITLSRIAKWLRGMQPGDDPWVRIVSGDKTVEKEEKEIEEVTSLLRRAGDKVHIELWRTEPLGVS